MYFERVVPSGGSAFKYSSSQKHTDRLAANKPRADRAFAHLKHVGKLEVAFGKIEDAPISGDYHTQEPMKYLCRFLVRLVLIGVLFQYLLCLQERAAPYVQTVNGKLQRGTRSRREHF